MMNFLRKLLPDTHPFRLLYHKITAFLAAVFYWFPADNMIVVGVTGTNGKTTTVNLITNILNEAGYKVGMTSTINFQIGNKKWVNDMKQTTMSPFKFQKLLRQMVKTGCKYAVLEVSSHAITQSRTLGVNVDIAVVTNVTPDHVEYHGGFDQYLAAKVKFFEIVSKSKRKHGVKKAFIVNADDQYMKHFSQYSVGRKLTYGLKSATVYASEIIKNPEETDFILHVPNDSTQINLQIPGEFNVYNSLAAASVALVLNVDVKTIKKGLYESKSVSGRYEHIDTGQKFDVIVDYAHATESLESLLALYKRLCKGKVFAVFGATGGGRDKVKRSKMGVVANENADFIIVTDDDPYSEDEWGIIEQVSEGIPRKEGVDFWKIPDRREAIRLALTMAKEGDCVVVAGKGCEEVMMVRGKKIKWNDRDVIEELLNRKIKVEIKNNVFEKRENVCFEG